MTATVISLLAQNRIDQNDLRLLASGSDKKPMIVHGGTKTGKSTYAKAIADHYGYDLAIDDWMPCFCDLESGMAAFTEYEPRADESEKYHILSIEEAIKAIKYQARK